MLSPPGTGEGGGQWSVGRIRARASVRARVRVRARVQVKARG